MKEQVAALPARLAPLVETAKDYVQKQLGHASAEMTLR